MTTDEPTPAAPAGVPVPATAAYTSTTRIDELRATEYRHLDHDGQVYLDYAGAGVAARAQFVAHHDRLLSGLYANPHSESPSSDAAGSLVESARRTVLRFFRADPAEYEVIFTPNASGACRLVGEAYAFGRRCPLVLTWDNHNSVNGIREYARAARAPIRYVPPAGPDLRVADSDVIVALAAGRAGLAGGRLRDQPGRPAPHAVRVRPDDRPAPRRAAAADRRGDTRLLRPGLDRRRRGTLPDLRRRDIPGP